MQGLTGEQLGSAMACAARMGAEPSALNTQAGGTHYKDCPILLDWHGSIADGRHRVLKAIALGKRTIKARRMTWKPDPCRREEVKS